MKVQPLKNQDTGEIKGYKIKCPACGEHQFWVKPWHDQFVWQFNGDVDKPTFTPSLDITWDKPGVGIIRKCHFFVTDGNIQFLSDCTHEYAGKTLPLIDY